MSVREITRDQWEEFLDHFSDWHRGWRVNVEVETTAGRRVEVRELPLVGISVEEKGSEAPAIAVMVGDRPEEHVTHVVESPRRVRFMENEDGAHAGLQIEGSDEGVTTVAFQPARKPLEAHVL